jgi:hypothetical protein
MAAMAQTVPVPFHQEPYALSSGVHDGRAAEAIAVSPQTVHVPGAAWLQLHFSEYNLGAQSYLTVTSAKDAEVQRLDANSLLDWEGSTAYFNGDTVEVALHVAAGERNIFFRIQEVTAGDRAAVQPESICGPTDNRVLSSDDGVGRIVPVGCTGWITANGSHLTAGHCVPFGASPVLQFRVPLSAADGTINNPPPADQFPINTGSVTSVNGGIGNDWAVFGVNRNAGTAQLPVERYGIFYRVARDFNPGTVRVTGFGTATGVRNQVQQTAAGPNLAPTGTQLRYQVSTTGGNSGSPVIFEGTPLTIGIHTNAGCTNPVGSSSNSGTSFTLGGLQNAINGFPGANARYVDQVQVFPLIPQEGTLFRPFGTVNQAVTAVPTAGIVSIVPGSYNEVMTINRAMTLRAPVGTVTIGAP